MNNRTARRLEALTIYLYVLIPIGAFALICEALSKGPGISLGYLFFIIVVSGWMPALIWIDTLPVGTKSLLFGVHQFAWHPVTVWIAWVRLYRELPSWRESVCILIHDWGYWGCENMDGEEGENHPAFGAKIARRLLGEQWHDFVLLHSRYLSARMNREPSRLCWADKFCMSCDPQWFYLIRARLSGEIAEYREKAARREFVQFGASHKEWHTKLVNHLAILSVQEAAKYQKPKPRLFYYEEGVGCWTPLPGRIEDVPTALGLPELADGERATVEVKRVDLTDHQLATLPEV